MVSVDGARLKRSCVLDDQKDVFKLGVIAVAITAAFSIAIFFRAFICLNDQRDTPVLRESSAMLV